jgi:AcrR family transcriptional regulator
MPRKPLSNTAIANFRDTFCDAAYELYVQKGYEGVTMRGIAKALGCSAMMAYRYFENKEEVFAALRAKHFDRLALMLEDVSKSLPPLEHLKNLARAYASFALENPDAYRLLYMIPAHQEATYPEVARAQLRTQYVLFDATRRAVDSGAIVGDSFLLAHTLWASIHGLVSLELSNQLKQGVGIDELLAAVLEHNLYRSGTANSEPKIAN